MSFRDPQGFEPDLRSSHRPFEGPLSECKADIASRAGKLTSINGDFRGAKADAGVIYSRNRAKRQELAVNVENKSAHYNQLIGGAGGESNRRRML